VIEKRYRSGSSLIAVEKCHPGRHGGLGASAYHAKNRGPAAMKKECNPGYQQHHAVPRGRGRSVPNAAGTRTSVRADQVSETG